VKPGQLAAVGGDAIRGFGCVQGLLGQHDRNGVDRGIHLFDAAQMRLDNVPT
jgi:hypothetical protein